MNKEELTVSEWGLVTELERFPGICPYKHLLDVLGCPSMNALYTIKHRTVNKGFNIESARGKGFFIRRGRK